MDLWGGKLFLRLSIETFGLEGEDGSVPLGVHASELTLKRLRPGDLVVAGLGGELKDLFTSL